MLLSIDHRRQWSDRKKKSGSATFNSYVFVQLSDADRNLVFQSLGVVRYFLLGRPLFIVDEEIDTIKWLSTEQYDVSVAAFQIGIKSH
jgi:hypothetical protein